ncbi:MAG: hypothetical protein JWO80_1242 [Bryobacterales bacterium]|nr:hypothetical protein [Bryobacterales bacterium]
MSLNFRYAQCDEYPRIAKFIDEYWAKDHVYVRDRALFEWTFQRPNFWEDMTYSFALAEDGDDIVGILGGIPFAFNAYGETRPAVWIVNYAVRPDHRKGAAALQLLSTFRNPSFPIVIASGLNPASAAIYQVLKGKVLPEAPRHFITFANASERMTRLLQISNPTWTKEQARGVAAFFQIKNGVAPQGEYGDTIPEDWDRANWPRIAAETVGASRDADYLNWRYLNHPSFYYRFITLPEGSRTGMLVWRLETVRQQTDADNGQRRVEVDRIGRVVEFLPASGENGSKLLKRLIRELHDLDALGADFYGYHGATRSVLAENGFHAVDGNLGGSLIPSRFQPLSPGGKILNAMFAAPGLPDCAGQPGCPWYWTKSDSDQDRPN